jgi:uncharacterized RmlC-like cupin family protein
MKQKLIHLPKITDRRGNLSFIEGKVHIPFEIKRVYWICDVPGGVHRGSHALRATDEVIIALSGSFHVNIYDGIEEHKINLNNPTEGLYVPRLLWRYLDDFSTNSVCLVLASNIYLAEDYIRDKEEFQRIIQK